MNFTWAYSIRGACGVVRSRGNSRAKIARPPRFARPNGDSTNEVARGFATIYRESVIYWTFFIFFQKIIIENVIQRLCSSKSAGLISCPVVDRFVPLTFFSSFPLRDNVLIVYIEITFLSTVVNCSTRAWNDLRQCLRTCIVPRVRVFIFSQKSRWRI